MHRSNPWVRMDDGCTGQPLQRWTGSQFYQTAGSIPQKYTDNHCHLEGKHPKLLPIALSGARSKFLCWLSNAHSGFEFHNGTAEAHMSFESHLRWQKPAVCANSLSCCMELRSSLNTRFCSRSWPWLEEVGIAAAIPVWHKWSTQQGQQQFLWHCYPAGICEPTPPHTPSAPACHKRSDLRWI